MVMMMMTTAAMLPTGAVEGPVSSACLRPASIFGSEFIL
jgi:hypothetical protein